MPKQRYKNCVPKQRTTPAVLIFFHPDCNCWSRSFTESADARRQPVADFTASGDFHPALKTKYSVVFLPKLYNRLFKIATPFFQVMFLYALKQEKRQAFPPNFAPFFSLSHKLHGQHFSNFVLVSNCISFQKKWSFLRHTAHPRPGQLLIRPYPHLSSPRPYSPFCTKDSQKTPPFFVLIICCIPFQTVLSYSSQCCTTKYGPMNP